MTNITLDGLPPKTGTISDAGIIHYREGGVDKKMTVADFLIRISEKYSADVNTFLGAADKAAGRAALGIARRTVVSNANYTILVTDKVVAQTGTMSAARTWSLPTAALYPAGEELIIIDQSGTVTPTNKIIVSRAGSDTIDGSTSIDITSAYGFVRLISDGVSKWKISNSLLNQATETGAGIAEIATQAETDAGTDDLRFVTPLKLATRLKSYNANKLITTSIVLGGLVTIPHGLGKSPDLTRVYLKCISAEGGYAVGDIVTADNIWGTTGTAGIIYGLSEVVDETNLVIRMSATIPRICTKNTGASFDISISKWNYIFTAFIF